MPNNSDSTRSNRQHAFYNNPKIRAYFYQFALLAGLVYFFYAIVSNTIHNMEIRGIKSGFDFLSTTAGFDILMSLIPFDATYSYGRTFVVGLLNTLLVSIIGIFFATLIGFLVGVSYFSHNWLVKKISLCYTELFRNIPPLLQIFFWYFAVLAALPSARQSLNFGETVFLNVRGLYLPSLVPQAGAWLVYFGILAAIVSVFVLRRWAHKRQDITGLQFPVFSSSLGILFGIPLVCLFLAGIPFTWDIPSLQGFNFRGGITIIPELMALSIALSLYTAAFIAEAVRAGVQSIPHGQTEAARSLGLKENKIISLIIIPQAMRVIVPLLNSEYQSLIKNSTLATAIGYPDLFTVFAGTTLNQTGQAIEIIFMLMLSYLTINMIVSFLMNKLNTRVALVERK